MAIDLPDKIINVARALTSNNQTNVLLYSPSFTTLFNTRINYQGYLYSLRLCSRIFSISETFAPLDNPIDTDYQREQKYQMFRSSERKTIKISLKPITPTTAQEIILTYIEVYHTKPIYLVNVMPFLTELDYYGIQHNMGLYATLIDNGYGVLTSDDIIYVNGVVIEKSAIMQDDSNVIYNFIGA